MARDKDILKLRGSHLLFMWKTWKAVDKFTAGFHTQKICSRIDKAIEDYRNGKSSYISIAVHPRAGKSEMISKYLPPHFLGEFPDNNVLSTTYNMDQATKFSGGALNVIKSDEYKEIYPDIQLKSNAVKAWSVRSPDKDIDGEVKACSLHAGLAGKGAHLAILDDYCANREDAESPTIRNKSWSAFTDDFMTRLAPVHIVIILATPWHVDDIRGRIKKKMEEDEKFPAFEFMDFPARSEHYEGAGDYTGDFLFTERYTKEWYDRMYATLGRYSSASLMDCNPVIRGGNILDVTQLNYHDTLDDFPQRIKYARVWDLGHKRKKKKTGSSDPTGGTLLGFRKIGMNTELRIPILELWIKDYIEFSTASPERDRRILEQVHVDGGLVDLVMEGTLDSIDTVNQVAEKIQKVKRTHIITVSKGKVIRIAPMESMFEMGRVHLLKASWNKRWLEGVEQFDGSETTHDEMIDNMSTGYDHLVKNKSRQRGASH